MATQKLQPALRNYPWGSRTMLAQLRGLPVPTASPEAELWFGAHPAGPSTLDGRPLDQIIAENPIATLGEQVAQTYDNQLPFLLKLLAADEPLSLQAHPSAEQAREGFDREQRAGIALDAPNRNYKDPSHKPEIIVALTDFDALAGFRPLEHSRVLFEELNCAALGHYLAMLAEDPEAESDNLRALFTTWITIPQSVRRKLVDDVVSCAKLWLEQHQHLPEDLRWVARALQTVIDLNTRYPGDIGVLGALLLNRVSLKPGEAIHIPAGQLHAYLHGMGVEVMANSDNVLRGGLTSKYIDTPELVRVLNFQSLAQPTVECVNSVFAAPVEEFCLHIHDLQQPYVHDHQGPAIALCTAGQIRTQDGLVLSPGEAAWLPAEQGPVSFSAGSSDATAQDGSSGVQLFIAQA